MKIYTVDEIRRVEEYENEHGTRFLRLMENAGSACARQIERYIRDKYVDLLEPQKSVKVCVVCGKGKNGGDGFVIARKLYEKGYVVKIVLAQGAPVAEDAVEMYAKVVALDIDIIRYDRDEDLTSQTIMSSDVIIDCIFGFGFHGVPNDACTAVFSIVNEAPSYVVSVDVPSGVNADTAEVEGACVQADMTLAITALKCAHVLFPAKKYCGVTEVLNIGISEEALQSVEPSLVTFEKNELDAYLPVRDELAHKNDFGHVLCVAGSMNMPGAACLCSKAALVTGAGLVTAAFPRSAYPSLSAHVPEVMLYPVAESEDGKLSASALPELLDMASKATVLVIGCGLGKSDDVSKVVTELIKNVDCPIVLDADGLNAIAKTPEVLREGKNVIITPHPGEMSRLCNCSVADIEKDRFAVAQKFSNEYNVTVLLKGPATIVASPDTKTKYINQTGNAGLAKGGSGDVLSGIIGGLLAQGLPAFEAASLGAYMHGYAADIVAPKKSKNAMLASDLFKGIKKLYLKFDR